MFSFHHYSDYIQPFSLSDVFCNLSILKSLRSVKINSNHLTYSPPQLLSHPQLENLDLGFNFIASFDLSDIKVCVC